MKKNVIIIIINYIMLIIMILFIKNFINVEMYLHAQQ